MLAWISKTEAYKAVRAHELMLNEARAELERAALAPLVALNGGAIVAFLTLLGALSGKNSTLSVDSALGGLAGTAVYDWLERHASLANIMRVGLVIETFTHLGLAVTTTSWVAMAIIFVFGAHAFIWGTTSRTIRMRAVPTELQGRVGSLYAIGVFGGILAGQAIGGIVARIWGVTAPFWFAFVDSAVILTLIWRELGHIAHTKSSSAS